MRTGALLATMALASCTQPPAGEAPRHRPTIVSLNPCSDAVLAEIADPGQLLAISHYSQNPASSSMDVVRARQFRAVSGSVEEVLALKPDLVIVDPFLPAPTRAAFDDLGLKTAAIPIATSVADSKAQVTELARLAGHPERGARLNARIEAALAKAAPPPGASPVPTLVWQSGGIVPGDRTLVTDLLQRTGLVSFSSARGLSQADYLPLEIVLSDPPNLILAAGNARSNEDRLLRHPALAALRATRREAFDSALLWCGGPTIIPAVERLARARDAARAGAAR